MKKFLSVFEDIVCTICGLFVLLVLFVGFSSVFYVIYFALFKAFGIIMTSYFDFSFYFSDNFFRICSVIGAVILSFNTVRKIFRIFDYSAYVEEPKEEPKEELKEELKDIE